MANNSEQISSKKFNKMRFILVGLNVIATTALSTLLLLRGGQQEQKAPDKNFPGSGTPEGRTTLNLGTTTPGTEAPPVPSATLAPFRNAELYVYDFYPINETATSMMQPTYLTTMYSYKTVANRFDSSILDNIRRAGLSISRDNKVLKIHTFGEGETIEIYDIDVEKLLQGGYPEVFSHEITIGSTKDKKSRAFYFCLSEGKLVHYTSPDIDSVIEVIQHNEASGTVYRVPSQNGGLRVLTWLPPDLERKFNGLGTFRRSN